MLSDRDRLIELIGAVQSIGVKYTHEETASSMGFRGNAELADYLLANGVIVQQQGKWKIKRDDCDFEYMMCSCCKEEFFPEGCVVEITPNFCPNCGAKMKEREGK